VTEDDNDYFTDTQIAKLLGVNPVTARQWRVKNKKLGELRYGPPYEITSDGHVRYPRSKFREWCAGVRVVGGVPHVNLPTSADREAIHQAVGNVSQAIHAS
jgi:hypothetical protein